MPDAPNHHLFVEDFLFALKQKPRDADKTVIAYDATALYAGTQGPDPFYFFGRLGRGSLSDRERIHAFAEYFHGSNPANLFKPLVLHLVSLENKGAVFLSSRSFLMGLLLHYVLDRAIHPYVYYRSGFSLNGTLDAAYSRAHARFEAELAITFFNELRPDKKIPAPYRLLVRSSQKEQETASRSDSKAILHLADSFFSDSFPLALGKNYYGVSWKDMIRVLTILHDPFGFKACMLDRLGLHENQGRAMMLPSSRRVKAGSEWGDVLNLDKHDWKHPETGSIEHASVPELYEAALRDALHAEYLLNESLHEGYCNSAWDDFFGGINHEGIQAGSSMKFRA